VTGRIAVASWRLLLGFEQNTLSGRFSAVKLCPTQMIPSNDNSSLRRRSLISSLAPTARAALETPFCVLPTERCAPTPFFVSCTLVFPATSGAALLRVPVERECWSHSSVHSPLPSPPQQFDFGPCFHVVSLQAPFISLFPPFFPKTPVLHLSVEKGPRLSHSSASWPVLAAEPNSAYRPMDLASTYNVGFPP